jgi:hypothetical protein
MESREYNFEFETQVNRAKLSAAIPERLHALRQQSSVTRMAWRGGTPIYSPRY